MKMIGEALRLFRVFHDKKANELAKELNISLSYICEIEKGSKRPSIDIIENYARVFKTTPSTIFYYVECLQDMEENDFVANKGVPIRIKLFKLTSIIKFGIGVSNK